MSTPDPTSAMDPTPMGDIDSSGVEMETTEADYTSDGAEEEDEQDTSSQEASNEDKKGNKEEKPANSIYEALQDMFDEKAEDAFDQTMDSMGKDSASQSDSSMQMSDATEAFGDGSGGQVAEMAAENPEVLEAGAEVAMVA